MTRADRLALWTAAATTIVLALVLAGVAIWTTRAPSASERDDAAVLAAADAASPVLRAAVGDCRGDPGAYGVADRTPPGRSRGCAEALAPDPQWYLARPALDASAVASVEGVLLGLGTTVVALVAGLALGRRQGPRVVVAGGAGAALGAGGAALLWTGVTVALDLRGLSPPDLAASGQVLRAAVAAATAGTIGAGAARLLGGRSRGAGLVVGLLVVSWVLPVSALDLTVDWLLGR